MAHEITRRDYLNATLLGAGALLTRGLSPAETMRASEFDGPGGVGDYKDSNGNTWQVLTEGHRIRDAVFEPNKTPAPPTGEHYDCIIVGGGISGLAAALFFTRQKPQAKCLIIENHPIFGGLAKQNEFEIDGQRFISNQASAMFFPPIPGTFLESFYSSIGINPRGWPYQNWAGKESEMAVGNTPYFDGSNHSGYFFGAKFGKPEGQWLIDPWGKNLEGAPISEQSRRELLKVHHAQDDFLPREHGDAQSRHMDSITLEQFLIERHGISQETVRNFLSPVAGGGAGIGADALSAYAEYAADVLLPWDHSRGVQMFPGGNTGVARHILKNLIPNALAGDTSMPGVSRGAVNFQALDRLNQPTRIRLHSTVVNVAQSGAAVRVTYTQNGKLHSFQGRTAILAGGSWTTKHLVTNLPDSHRIAYDQFHRSPALVASVALRNWRFLYEMGMNEFQWFEGVGNYTAIRRLATLGNVSPTISPDSPVVLTLKILFSYPNLPLEEQNRRGRNELFSTPYAQYEKAIRNQLQTMFAAYGFDASRDIAGLILNRWGHAYLSAQPGFFFGTPTSPAPGEVLRKNPVGRITFANSDLSGIMDHRASILEAQRAVTQAIERL